MIEMMKMKNVVGDSSGRVMCRNFRHLLAPSISAASYRCCGIPCNPARKMTIA